MRHYIDIVANQANVLVPNAQINVYLTGTLTHAALFSDNGITPKSNPTFTDSLGRFDFYIADGVYDISVSGGSISTSVQTAVEIADVTQTSPSDADWQTQLLELANQATGTQPPPGFVSLYSKTPSKHIFAMDDTGTETDLFLSSSGNLLPTNNFWTGTNSFQNNVAFKGPNPWADITQYGGRSISPAVAPAKPGVTGNCLSGSPVISGMNGSGNLINGDGVTIWGCGPANGLSTPNAPTVTPSVSSGPTGTGMVVNAPSGASTYQYQIVAVTKDGGYTPAGSVGTTNNGNALGWQTVNLSSCSKSNNTVTCTSANPHGLVAGAHVRIQNTTDSVNFGGWYVVTTATDNTHFTYKSSSDTRAGSTLAVTGGTVGWFNENHLSWTPVPNAFIYLIYGNTVSGMTLLGVSKVQNVANTITDATFDDFGSPMMSTPVFLNGQYPTTPPSVGRPDSLTSTISSGGGTSIIELANSASSTTTGTTILYDAAPALKAALAVTGLSNVYIPYGPFPLVTVINSYVSIPGLSAILQQGILQINGTLELTGDTQWYGNVFPQRAGVPSFANGGGAPVDIGTSIPGVFMSGSSTLKIKGLNFTGPSGFNHITLDNINSIVGRDLNFGGTGGTSDAMTMPLLVRLCNFQSEYSNVTMLGSQTGNSSTPLLFCNGCSSLKMNLVNFSGRGIFFNGDFVNIDGGRKQGGTSPMLFRGALSGPATVGGIGGVPFTASDSVFNYELDTDPNPMVSTVVPLNSTTGIKGLVISGGFPTTSADTGGFLPLVSGGDYLYYSVLGNGRVGASNGLIADGSPGIYGNNLNLHPTYGNNSQTQYTVNQNVNLGAGNGLTVPFVIPVPTATAITGGSCTAFPAAGNYVYNLSVVGPDGVESTYGNFSNTITLDGATQCGSLSWTDTAGVVGYKVYVRGVTGSVVGPPGLVSQGTCNSYGGVLVTSSACVDVHTFINSAGQLLNGTGNPSLYPGLLTTNKLKLGSITGGNYGVGTLQGNFTANRVVTVPDASFTLGQGIVNGTSALGTSAIAPTTCATAVTTTATGTASTDTIDWAFNAAPSGAYTTGLTILPYATTNNVNFLVCNPTAGSLTPPAATLNWKISR